MTCKGIRHAICVPIKVRILKIINQYFFKFSLLTWDCEVEEEEEEIMHDARPCRCLEGGFYVQKENGKAKKSVHCCVQNLNSPHISIYISSLGVGFFYYLKQINAEILFALTSTFSLAFRSRNIYSSCLWISWMLFLHSFLRSLYLLLKIASCLLNIIMQQGKQRRRKGKLSNHLFHASWCSCLRPNGLRNNSGFFFFSLNGMFWKGFSLDIRHDCRKFHLQMFPVLMNSTNRQSISDYYLREIAEALAAILKYSLNYTWSVARIPLTNQTRKLHYLCHNKL